MHLCASSHLSSSVCKNSCFKCDFVKYFVDIIQIFTKLTAIVIIIIIIITIIPILQIDLSRLQAFRMSHRWA